MAANAACVQPVDSSTADPEQIARKFGDGGMLAGGLAGGRIPALGVDGGLGAGEGPGAGAGGALEPTGAAGAGVAIGAAGGAAGWLAPRLGGLAGGPAGGAPPGPPVNCAVGCPAPGEPVELPDGAGTAGAPRCPRSATGTEAPWARVAADVPTWA